MRFKHSARAMLLLFCGGVAGQATSPTISDFTPKFASPGEIVVITGSAFYYSSGPVIDPVVEVRFGNGSVVPPSFYISADTQIIATNPASATTGLISVRKSTGAWVYSSQTFTVIGPGPYVSSFTQVGSPVTIDGAHFTGTTAVRFNGVNAVSFYAGSDTRITEVSPPANVTTGPITVVTPQGSFTTASNYFVPPVITGFAPPRGRSGTNVVVTGQNFLGTANVYFNGQPVSFAPPTNNTTLVATVPVGAMTGPIQVNAPAGAYPTSSNFVVQPTVSGFAPGFGPVGTSVTVSGANFTAANLKVYFNGVQSSSVSGVSFGQLTATVPSTTTGPVTVTTADGAGTSAQNFYLPASITSFTPTNSAPGSRVTVTGNNFSNATVVSFNGAAAVFTVTNNTTLGATVPAAVSTGPISVTTPAGTATSARLFYAAPVINSFNPTHGLPGTNVSILGTNFLGARFVRFNGMNATFNVVNNGQVNATVPTGAQTGPISVGAPAGTNTTAASFTLDYTADLGVTVVDTPDPVLVGSNLVYSVVVTNKGPFASPATVLTDTLPASVNLKSASTTQGSLNTSGNPITASLGNLNVGASATITLTVAPQTTGSITNTANVTGQYADPVGTNDTARAVTTVQPLPLLSIRLISPNRVRVSWPVALSNFTLEFKPGLATTYYWSNATSTMGFSGEERFVTETNNQPARFYRLRQ